MQGQERRGAETIREGGSRAIVAAAIVRDAVRLGEAPRHDDARSGLTQEAGQIRANGEGNLLFLNPMRANRPDVERLPGRRTYSVPRIQHERATLQRKGLMSD